MTQTFETTIIHFKKDQTVVLCAECGQNILNLPMDEPIYAQKFNDQENVFLCKTGQGKFLLIEIL